MAFDMSPVPWVADFAAESSQIPIRDADGNPIADVRHAGTHRTRYHAKLLAAAPRLLVLAREILKLNALGVFDLDGTTEGRVLMTEVREVIRNMEG
jgi:hypothetical protein